MYQVLFLKSSELFYISIGPIPISALGAVIGILITIAVLFFSVGMIVFTEIVTIVIVMSSFLFPYYTYINSLASHISFLSLASLPSSCLLASLEYYFAALHTSAALPPPYVYSNCLPSPGPLKVPPGELANGEFLSNVVLFLKYKSIAIH